MALKNIFPFMVQALMKEYLKKDTPISNLKGVQQVLK